MSRGPGRTQRAILRHLAESGADTSTDITIAVYQPHHDLTAGDPVSLRPVVYRALHGLERAGLVARAGRVDTGHPNRATAVLWTVTDTGRALAAHPTRTETR